jgi:ribosome-associated protein
MPPATPAQPDPGDDRLTLAPGVTVHADALRFTYSASSGPGGQNVNKRATRAQMRLPIDDLGLSPGVRSRFERLASAWITADGEVLIASDEHRTQRRNRQECLDRLRSVLVEAQAVPKKRRPTKPSRGAIERRLESKRQRSETKKRRRPPTE